MKLLAERFRYWDIPVPNAPMDQRQLLRSLMNVRPLQLIGKDFLVVQDDYLREELAQKGVTALADLMPISKGIYLW